MSPGVSLHTHHGEKHFLVWFSGRKENSVSTGTLSVLQSESISMASSAGTFSLFSQSFSEETERKKVGPAVAMKS